AIVSGYLADLVIILVPSPKRIKPGSIFFVGGCAKASSL
ncbi:unnamed protein product, partial [marine sediment metagenome]